MSKYLAISKSQLVLPTMEKPENKEFCQFEFENDYKRRYDDHVFSLPRYESNIELVPNQYYTEGVDFKWKPWFDKFNDGKRAVPLSAVAQPGKEDCKYYSGIDTNNCMMDDCLCDNPAGKEVEGEKKLCPDCHGNGFTTNGEMHHEDDYREYDCDTCDSSGYLPAPDLTNDPFVQKHLKNIKSKIKYYKDAHQLAGELINKHIKPLFNGLQKASVEYFCEKGTISGAFYEALTSMIIEAIPGCADHLPSPGKQEGNPLLTVKDTETSRKNIHVTDNGVFVGYIYPEVDGDYVFAPECDGGVWSDYVLKAISDILFDLNKDNPVHYIGKQEPKRMSAFEHAILNEVDPDAAKLINPYTKEEEQQQRVDHLKEQASKIRVTGKGDKPVGEETDIVKKIVEAQVGTQRQSDDITKHMNDYFTRFPSYKTKFTSLEWHHIFLDFYYSLQAPAPSVAGEQLREALEKIARGPMQSDKNEWSDYVAGIVKEALSSPQVQGDWVKVDLQAGVIPPDGKEVQVCFEYQPDVIQAYYSHENGKWYGSRDTRDYMADGFVRDSQIVDTPTHYRLVPALPPSPLKP